jgi:translation initiation factor 2B subunit (eIF-2B alpha/beta/delta family)
MGLSVPPDWVRLLRQIKQDRRSGASVLLGRAIEAGRLFLAATRLLSPDRLHPALVRFTRLLTASQPSIAPFLNLANALWLGVGDRGENLRWIRLHDAMAAYAEGVDRGLAKTVRHGARLVKSRSLVLTYSHSAAVRMALLQALAAGRRFEVVCSESRPMSEGVSLARRLALAGVLVHLTTDAALPGWMEQADLFLVGADAVVGSGVVNKTGTEPLAQAARRTRVPAYVLADSSKWLPAGLAGFLRMREQAPGEIAPRRHPNVRVHNRYFDRSPLPLFAGVVWEEGIAPPSEVRGHIARLETATDLIALLERQPLGRRP